MREDGEPVETPLRIDWSNALLGAMQSYADALIEIAAAFKRKCPWAPMELGDEMVTVCLHCECRVEYQCRSSCPGLKARRALGIA